MNDLRYSVRSFARTPGSTLALVLSIALGVGSNAAVHGFANGLIVRDTPVRAHDRVVSLFARDAQRSAALSYDEYLSLKAETGVFDWVGAVRESRGTLVHDGQSAIVALASVTAEPAEVFKLPLREGAVVSDRLWRSEFEGKADAVGATVSIEDVPERIDAVAPAWLDGLYAGTSVDVWMPLRDETIEELDRTSRSIWVLAQVRAGVTINEARTAVNAGRDETNEIGVTRYTGMTPEMTEGVSRISALLELASAAVFFIACANVASFLLGRASARVHETSVRVALGASRGRLIRQLLGDSILIAVTGTVSGLLLALWTTDVIPALFFQEDAEQLIFAPDSFRLLLTAVACGAVTIACGLLPLIEMRHDRPAAVLQRENAGPSRRTRRLRAALVVGQVTCCSVLVISAAFVLHGFRWSLRTGLGRELGEAVLVTVHTETGGLSYFENIEAAAGAMPGVSEAMWASRLPGSRPVWQSLRIDAAQLPLHPVTIDVAAFTPESLPLVTLPPVSGRMFGGRDTRQSCPVAVVNEEAAQELFGGDASGRTVLDSADQRIEIIGVVASRKMEEAARIRPTLFYYGDQRGEPHDWVGPSRFRVPAAALPKAMLDANVVSSNYFARNSEASAAQGSEASAAQGSEASAAQGSVASAFRRKSGAAAPCRTAVINQQAADRYFSGDPVGSGVIDAAGRRTEIVGVVQSPPLSTFQRAAEPAIYYPMAEDFTPRMTLILRTSGVNEAWLTTLARRVEGVRGAFSLPIVKTLDAYLRQTSLAPLRIASVLVPAFAAIALALGVLGLYSALSDAARQQRREIALRIALGAQAWRITRQVVGEGGRLAAVGTAAGMVMSVVAVQRLRGVTPSGVPLDVWIWLAAPIVLLAAVILASILPALRALAIDPLVITRADN